MNTFVFPATFTPYQKCYKKWRTSGICWKINAPRETFKKAGPSILLYRLLGVRAIKQCPCKIASVGR